MVTIFADSWVEDYITHLALSNTASPTDNDTVVTK